MALSANVSASSEVTLKDIETFESLGGAGGDEAQEKSTAFLDASRSVSFQSTPGSICSLSNQTRRPAF
jgi:hypothetical protein